MELLDEIEPVVLEKSEFDSPQKAKLMALFGIFRLTEILFKFQLSNAVLEVKDCRLKL